MSKEILQVTPVAVLAVLPVVPVQAILVNFFLRVFIHYLGEVTWREVIARILFAPLASCPLFIFQSCLLFNG